MDLASIKTQRQVLDVFENLFHKYSNLTELPKFKKRRLSQVGNSNSKVCKNQQKSSNLSQSHQSSLKTLRSVEHLEEQAGDASLRHHAKDMGSFSSGVFSIDSDIDNLNDEDENHVEEQVDSRIDHVGHEENSLSSEAPSEAGSGIVDHPLRKFPFSEERQDLKDDLQEGNGKLTDEDVLFLMHKPRLKKRRKKPPWQRRKLDLDDLWVKGQHLQNYHGSDQKEEVTTKLFLERNLRWGKISLKNYVCAVRKSRKGRKRLNNSSRNRSAGQTQSVKGTLSENKSSVTVTSNAKLKMKKAKNELPAGTPQKRSSFENVGKKQTMSGEKKVRKKAQKSTRWREDVSEKTSDTSEQDYQPRSEAGLSSHAFPKEKCGSDTSISAKEGKGKTTGKSQRSSTKAKGSRTDMFDSKAKGRLKKTEGAKNRTVSGGKRGSLISGGNSSTSRGNSSWNVTDGDSEDTMTQNGHCRRPRQSSRTSSERTKRDSNRKSGSAPTPARSNSWHYYDLEQETGSQETVINFISLTPRKSRKLSRRKRRSEEKRDTNPMSTLDSSDSDGYFRGVSLHPRGSLLTSDSPELEDEEEVECRPLFSHGKHCGGVWNTIIEESS